MNMKANYESKSDKELLRIYLEDQNSRLGREAKEELEYRKYREAKKQNAELIKLTKYMTCAIATQVALAVIQFVVCIIRNR